MNRSIKESIILFLVIAAFVTSILSVMFYYAEKNKPCNPGLHSQQTEFKHNTVVKVTTYRAEIGQTDSTPFITADGSVIDSTSTNWCAVSDDLFLIYNFGDTIDLVCANNKYSGKWIVHDRMNSRYTNYVDCLITGKGGLWMGVIRK